jgi:hypothetical protein
MRDRRLAAAALWFLLAFLVWNVRFDYGVRISARSYLNHRALYLRGDEPRTEMASAMRAGVGQSARAATLLALPAACVAVCLVASRVRRLDGIPQARDRPTRPL